MKQIFINILVEHIEKSMGFYTQLGFSMKPLFSDDEQKCMFWSKKIYIMLLSKKRSSLTVKRIFQQKNNGNAYFTLPAKSLDKVNDIVESGLKAGGKESIPMIDEGFMQIRRFEVFDDHIWDIIFIEEAKYK